MTQKIIIKKKNYARKKRKINHNNKDIGDELKKPNYYRGKIIIHGVIVKHE